ncbi:MAG: hypothetical protein JWP91_3005 [Fibrobacteres bacterium]|nr:hypothetical protein [Fibrobacterota bacterium]
MSRTRLARILAVIIIFSISARPCLAGSKVFVFYPSLARPLAIQEALAKKCPGLEITVFGRLTDLQALVLREHPQAILAQNAVLRQFPEYLPRLQGNRNGSATENFVLLSIDKPLEASKVSAADIGVVGMLDRKEMDAFVGNLVSGTPRVNRVTKVEDLLPLLIFQSVAAVLVSEANVREFQKKSQAHLVEAKLEKGKVGLVAAGIRAAPAGTAPNLSGEREVLSALKALDAGTLALLGVDAWK